MKEIEEARLAYWAIVHRACVARGVSPTTLVSEQAQYVTADGRVYYGGFPGIAGARYAGRIGAGDGTWAKHGTEAAPPPWAMPPRVKDER